MLVEDLAAVVHQEAVHEGQGVDFHVAAAVLVPTVWHGEKGGCNLFIYVMAFLCLCAGKKGEVWDFCLLQ